MRVYAHRNLRTGGWSVQHRGLVIDRPRELMIRGAEFRVRPGGHARALREGRRNVHAFVVGDRVAVNLLGLAEKHFSMVRYDLQRGAFVNAVVANAAIMAAEYVWLSPSGAVYAWGIET